MRVFAYLRVSTPEQSPENQLMEIRAAGFAIEERRAVSEVISGATPAAQRPALSKLMDRLEAGDVLVVSRLDRLGRSAMDVRATVDRLVGMGVRVHCLALGGTDLTSAAGKMTLQVLAAVAEFERDLLVERTHAGIQRARREGKRIGRPARLTAANAAFACDRLRNGATVATVARELGVSRQTVMRASELAASYRLAPRPEQPARTVGAQEREPA